jgi:hypothetical protein
LSPEREGRGAAGAFGLRDGEKVDRERERERESEQLRK